MSSQPPNPSSAAPAEACPVDHATREAWLKNNGPKHTPFAPTTKPSSSSAQTTAPSSQPPPPSTTTDQTKNSNGGGGGGIFSWLRSPFTTSDPTPQQPPPKPSSSLGTTREISTIPRASTTVPDGHGSLPPPPANSEIESGPHNSGNWVYPSEKMFFEAMKRKGYTTTAAAEMKTVVPIHNAVNERAWAEIKAWEKPYGAETQCGGPRLHSFLGLSTTLSPKARWNGLLGYTKPFDRHDWVVDRCGVRVEYIIDFYAGKPKAGGKGGEGLSFYLDVRPKLNTWEGWKMRGAKFVGWV